jgi:RND family efflux transporter MFP subunit
MDIFPFAKINSAVFCFALLAAGCGQAPSESGDKRPQVDVTTPVMGTVTDYEDFTGRLDALKTTDIRARVQGYVLKAPFKEGDEVHEGDVLFEIDPRTYEADRNQADANLRLAKADSNLQQKIAKRATTLARSQAMSQEDYDTAMATADKSQATVKANEAALNRCKLYVDFTKVTAPWSGRISRRLVDPGNLVLADNTILTTLVTEDPLYAYFDVNERTYLEMVDSAGSHQTGSSSSPISLLGFPVLMRLANEGEFTRPGKIDFVDNRVNATTGTIRMRGVFPNEFKTLKPGLFVRIRLPIGAPYKAILIPDEAVLSDQGRKYVFVVDKQNKVVYRPVELGQEIQGLRVIKKGVDLGERLIVSGTQRVRAKDEVRIGEEKEPPKAPQSRLSQLLASIKSDKTNNGRPADKEAKKPAAKESGSPAPASAVSGN